MSLEEYREKRSFAETPEPEGVGAAGSTETESTAEQPSKRRFVIQKHGARRTHFDLRLEHRGVLKSWAVPRGPSIDPHQRRLAIATEDHPLEYLQFEGLIPEGHYGAGPMLVWDQGVWHCQGDVDQAYQRGLLKLELAGRRLAGRWSLIRTGGPESKQWLLVREKSDPRLREKGDADLPDREPVITERTSVLSGRTLEEIREEGNAGRRRPEPRQRACQEVCVCQQKLLASRSLE